MQAPYAQGALVWNRISYDAGPLGSEEDGDTVFGINLAFAVGGQR